MQALKIPAIDVPYSSSLDIYFIVNFFHLNMK